MSLAEQSWAGRRLAVNGFAEEAQAPLQELPAGAQIHMIGVAGAGMNALASVLLARGYAVSGSDQQWSPHVARLVEQGLVFYHGHQAAQLGAATLVIISSAVPPTNPELAAARASAIPVVKRAAALGWLLRPLRTIAVAGTHGKTTTSSMLAVILQQAAYHPTYVIGGEVLDLGASAAWGRGDWAVVEADEYDHSFLQLRPEIAVITNVEPDHLEYFGSVAAMHEAYQRFVARIVPGGTLVVNADDPYLCAMELPPDLRLVRCGLPAADGRQWTVGDAQDGPDGIRFTLCWEDRPGSLHELHCELVLSGLHTARNAMQACAAAAAAAVSTEEAGAALRGFHGAGRRFQLLGEVAGVRIVDDYAHHPTEIRATLAAARSRFPGCRIIAVFQPHTYSRMRMLFDGFVSAFDAADLVLLTAIYAARETDTLGISASDLYEALEARRAGSVIGPVPGPSEALAALLPMLKEGDVVLTLGAGSITEAGPRLLAALSERQAHQVLTEDH